MSRSSSTLSFSFGGNKRVRERETEREGGRERKGEEGRVWEGERKVRTRKER